MIVEILIAQQILSFGVQRRSYFWVRLIGYGFATVLMSVCAVMLYSILSGESYDYGETAGSLSTTIFNLSFYICIFVVTSIIYWLCYKQSIVQALSTSSVAYALQHMGKNVDELLHNMFELSNVWIIAIRVIVFACILVLVYFFFVKGHTQKIAQNRKNRARLIISLLVVFICIGMSRLTSDNIDRNSLSIIAESIYAIVCCVLVLVVQFGFYEVEHKADDVAMLEQIMSEERKQFVLSKETIDLINIKCHDLKHQISGLKKETFEENISSIEDAVMIYDCTVKTGNEVLDIILTEKKLQCESKKIHMVCVARGQHISFMETIDIYTLFGNVLSNAIESSSKIVEEDKRCINIKIKMVKDMLVISVDNYFIGEVEFANGLPVTSKDQKYHGFGMRSIERIVKKYDGELVISAKKDHFTTKIFFPVKKEIKK